MGRPQLNPAEIGNEFARALSRYHHREMLGFRREWHDGAEWDRDGRMWNFTETDRSDHAGFQLPVSIVTVTSTAKIRFRVSAAGEMLVTRPFTGAASFSVWIVSSCPRCTRLRT